MQNPHSIILGATLLAASLAMPAAGAVTEGNTANGRPYVSGGIGQGEVEQLKQRAEKFSLQLIVSARSGAYLADMNVRITGIDSQQVLDTQLNAPWLLVDLAPGAYTVAVTHAGKVQERKVTLAAGKREQIVMQFDVAADTAGNGAKTATK